MVSFVTKRMLTVEVAPSRRIGYTSAITGTPSNAPRSFRYGAELAGAGSESVGPVAAAVGAMDVFAGAALTDVD